MAAPSYSWSPHTARGFPGSFALSVTISMKIPATQSGWVGERSGIHSHLWTKLNPPRQFRLRVGRVSSPALWCAGPPPAPQGWPSDRPREPGPPHPHPRPMPLPRSAGSSPGSGGGSPLSASLQLSKEERVQKLGVDQRAGRQRPRTLLTFLASVRGESRPSLGLFYDDGKDNYF